MVPFGKNWFHEMNDRRTLIVFVGLAATLVVLAVAWQGFLADRFGAGQSVQEARFLRLLPSGAEVGEDGILPLDVPVGAAAVGYSLNGRAQVMLIAPGPDGRLAVMGNVDLTEFDPLVFGRPQLYAVMIGPGAAPAVMVRLPAAFDAAATAFVLLDGPVLADRFDGAGERHPAVFYTGNVVEGHETFSLQDVNGDGVPEAVVSGRYVAYGDGTPGYNDSVDVYLWENGAFRYDRETSRTMTLSNGIFPEPLAEEAE